MSVLRVLFVVSVVLVGSIVCKELDGAWEIINRIVDLRETQDNMINDHENHHDHDHDDHDHNHGHKHNEDEYKHDENVTEVEKPDVDSDGCRTTYRDELERRCFEDFEKAIGESLEKEGEEAEKAACCAVEGYEKCSVQGYRLANCGAAHQAVKETLKAARMFMGALANNSCSGYRGKCGHVHSGAALPKAATYIGTLSALSALFLFY